MKVIKSFLLVTVALAITIFISGCSMFGGNDESSPFPVPKKVEDYTGPEKVSQVIANKILDKTFKGIKDNNYKYFSYRFNLDLKKRITEDKFEKMREGLSSTIGEYENREYLGALQKGPLMIYLWKAEFSKAKNNDLVIRLTLGELDEAVQVFAFEISNR